jgi:hypothetical protein
MGLAIRDVAGMARKHVSSRVLLGRFWLQGEQRSEKPAILAARPQWHKPG